jgi:hypothetical protein
MGHYRFVNEFERPIELAAESPLIVGAGVSVALWGLSLLSAAVPSLACTPSIPRSLRLASMGVRIAAALVGLVDGIDPNITGTLLSVGVVLAFSLEHMFSTYVRSQTRSKI